jgi:hypothetical protein
LVSIDPPKVTVGIKLPCANAGLAKALENKKARIVLFSIFPRKLLKTSDYSGFI